MANQYNRYTRPSESSPSTSTNGYEALMTSLISPGPVVQSQKPSLPWNGHPTWPHNGSQGKPNYNVPYQGLDFNHNAWQHNYQNGFNQHEYGNDDEMITVDDTGILRANGQMQASPRLAPKGQLPEPPVTLSVHFTITSSDENG